MKFFGLFNISLSLLLDENNISRVKGLAGKGLMIKSLVCPCRFLDCEDGEDDPQKYIPNDLDESVKYPMDMPVSLHFNQSDVFDGKHDSRGLFSCIFTYLFCNAFNYIIYFLIWYDLLLIAYFADDNRTTGCDRDILLVKVYYFMSNVL